MTDSSTVCPSCQTPGAGKFCSHCGSPRGGATCAGCGAPLGPAARFCSRCGSAVGGPAALEARDRTPWIIAGASLVALLAAILVMVARKSPGAPPGSLDIAAATQPAGNGTAPPDISNLSPRERFNRLYNRVMRAAQEGDEATVTRFTPMALAAYAQLDSIDADARYHAALLKVHTGGADESRALADTILATTPGHLFGYVIRGTVARFRKDDKALNQAYTGFLQRYDAEMKLNRPEYGEHRTSLDQFRKAAQAAATGTSAR